jgi:hypothetical protein
VARFRQLVQLIWRALRITILAIRFITPWVGRAAWLILRLIVAALTSLWVGVPNAIRSVTDEVMVRAVRSGFPTRFDWLLRWSIYIIAFVEILTGWVLFALITSWIIEMIL